jgi:flagellar biosynthesis protein
VDLDDEIPLSLFVAIAEVLAFTYHLKGKTPVTQPRVNSRRIFDPD